VMKTHARTGREGLDHLLCAWYSFPEKACLYSRGGLSVILPSSGLLHGVRWSEADVWRLPVRPFIKGQAVPLNMGTVGGSEASV
jgi:hypothetical protein